MADSPNLSQRKNNQERTSNLSRRASDNQSSPFSYDDSQARSSYPMQPHLQQRKIFGFEIYVDNDILSELGGMEQWFASLATIHQVEHIGFNSDLTIPDLNGRNIQIYDVEMEKKYQCAKAMLAEVYSCFKRSKKEAFSVIVFVPEGMVSLLIGAKGHQINKIMKESHTTIVVNQPISRMTYRTAKIQGYHSDIAKACRIIYEMLEEKSAIAYSIEKEPSQLDYTKSKIKSKFIFTDQLASFLDKRKKKLLQRAEEETKCAIKFQSEKENRLLKKEESVCVLNGRLEDVQSMVVVLINVAHDFLSEDKRNLDYTLKMLIPANYVTKLIGQKGYMIRDIIERSGGAQIKILSDKQEKDRQCIISINGSKQNKIDAACFIMEQIQCFKNGGPILQSGKSINENLAQQFKNSLQIRQDEIIIPIEKESQELVVASTQIEPERERDRDKQKQKEKERENEKEKEKEKEKQKEKEKEKVREKEKQKEKEKDKKEKEKQKEKEKEKEDGSEEEGLIQAEEEQKGKDRQEREREEKERIERQKRLAIERDLERINPLKKQKEHSRRSRSRSVSNSRSRSRDNKKKSKKMQFSRKMRSESESAEYKHDRDHVELKVVVPKKLGQDHKELKYIESLCKSTLVANDQKLESGEVIITVRGTMKDNCRCIQLLQKRLARLKSASASSAR